jgi:hypothetical protein
MSTINGNRGKNQSAYIIENNAATANKYTKDSLIFLFSNGLAR